MEPNLELAMEQGYLDIRDVMTGCSSDMVWVETGEKRIYSQLLKLLDRIQTDDTALPLVHVLLYMLLRASHPSATALAAFLTGFAEHSCIFYLREALIDAVVSIEELDTSRREELARFQTDSGGEDTSKADEGATAESRTWQLLRILITTDWITSEQAAHILPATLLTHPSVSLLPANSSIAKHLAAERRKRTTAHYKQKKFNISREASEGYASLVALLADERFLGVKVVADDTQAREKRAKAMWRECLAIIGWYDLSPQRVLDLILDAFCQNLASHWSFYLDLLMCTPWSKRNEMADVEGTGLVTDDDAHNMAADQRSQDDPDMTDFHHKLTKETGNRVLTQVLGFKFSHHRYDERDLKGVEQNPEAASIELFYVTAILIREGLVRTVDILSHLTPDDSAMESLARKYKLQTQQDIRNLGGNALVMAAALPDDESILTGATDGKPESDAPKPRTELPEQKIQLCEALLAIGQLSSAFYILSRWPIIAQYSERVAMLVMRLARFSVKPAYDSVQAARNQDMPPPAPNYRTFFPFGEPEIVNTLHCPEPVDTERRRFRFFYDEWHTSLKRCHRPEEVIDMIHPLIGIVGARAAADVAVLVWLCRIGLYHMELDSTELTRSKWINLIRTTLLPAMPLLSANYGYNNELWPLLKPLPYRFRYSLYGEWHVAMTESKDRSYVPAMGLAAAAVQNTTKQTLKRMTSELNRAHARAIGKGSYSAPTALWQAILPQIMSYENMIDTVVESARYLSALGWDVTMFMLLDALSDESKERVKNDGLTASAWLQAVSSFIGRLAKRYTAMPLEPLVQQIGNQLKRQSLADLITLKQLISKMSGIEIAQDMTKAQVACLAGGALMQREAIDLTQIRHPAPPTDDNERMTRGRPKKSPIFENSKHRLLQALQSSGLTLPILVAIVQAREACVFVATENLGHTKQLGLAFDDCHNAFTQYLRLLSSGLSTDDFAALLPPFRRLHQDFAVGWDIGFHMIRSQLTRSLYNDREAYLRLRLGWKNRVKNPEDSGSSTWNEDYVQPPLLPLVADSQHCVPPEIHSEGLEPFVVSFWQLALPEITVPTDAYAATITRLRSSISRLDNWINARTTTAEWVDAYRANKTELSTLADKLSTEQEEQEKVVTTAAARLDVEKMHWFAEKGAYKGKRRLASLLHTSCFYPRAIYSTADALFAARFGRHLHDIGTPNFSLLLFYEEFFPDSLVPLIFACSEAEVGHLGQCLAAILKDIERWHASKEVYDREALGTNSEDGFAESRYGMRLEGTRLLTWDMFRNMSLKWHRRLTRAIISCLEASDYLHVKNGLTLAQRLIPVFPKVTRLYEDVLKALEAFQARERAREDSREDLLLVVNAYTSLLEAAKRDRSLVLIPTNQYCVHPGQTAVKAVTPGKAEPDAAVEASAKLPEQAQKQNESVTSPMEVEQTPTPEAKTTEMLTAKGEENIESHDVAPELESTTESAVTAVVSVQPLTNVTAELTELADPVRASVTPPAVSATSAVDLKALREQLTLRKAQGRPKAMTPSGTADDATSTAITGIAGEAMDVDSSSTLPDRRPPSGVDAPGALIKGESPAPVSLETAPLPKGPRADLERSSTPRGPSNIATSSREASPAVRARQAESSLKTEMLPPPAPREMREKDSARSLRRDSPPSRRVASRAASVESKASRTSLSRRGDTERKRGARSPESRKGDADETTRSSAAGSREKARQSEHRDDRERERVREADRESERRRSKSDRDRHMEHERDARSRDKTREKDTRDRLRDGDKERSDQRPKNGESDRSRRDGDRSERDRDVRSRTGRERDDKRTDRDGKHRDRDQRDRDRDRDRNRNRSPVSERGSRISSRDDQPDRRIERNRDERNRERSPGRDRRRESERPEDIAKPKGQEDRVRPDRLRDERNSRRDTRESEEDARRGGDSHLDALATRFEDSSRKASRDAGSDGRAGQEPRSSNGDSVPTMANLRLAERMGLTSRSGSDSSIGVSTAMSSAPRPKEDYRLRTPRDAPPHARIENVAERNGENPSNQAASRPPPEMSDSGAQSVEGTNSPKPSLSSRLGVFAEPSGNHSRSSRNGDRSEQSRSQHPTTSPDRKRGNEDVPNEGSRGSAPPSNPSKRPKIDRVGARERGGALSRLSGGLFNKK